MQYSYHSLAEQIRQQIRNGRYPVGSRLPSVRACAAGFGVSTATAVRCYRHLEDSGWIVARAKSGMFVAERNSPAAAPSPSANNASKAVPAPPQFEQLMSQQHRMSQLYALTNQPLQLALHLATAAPDWYPCKALASSAQRLLRAEPQLIGAYPTGTGLPAFKTQLLAWLQTAGLDLAPDELLITCGSTEALNVALRAVAQPGDAVVVESPVYFGLLQMLENLGLQAVEVPCIPGEGISLEALEFALDHHHGVRAVVAMPSFQNPLGCSMSERNKRRLLKLVEQHSITLIEDDTFGDLSYQAERWPPVKAWDRYGRVVYCGSCSKSLAPGFRVGWVAGGRHHARIQALKLSQSLVAPLLEQAVLADFMAGGGHTVHLRRLRERLAGNVPLALQAVQRYFPRGTQVVSPAGGWWLWLELPAQVDTLELLRLAVAQGIAFTPGVVFSNTGKYHRHLRMNIGRPWGREMERGLQTLGTLALEVAARAV